MEAKAWPPGKFRHVTEFGEAFEQTSARAILQFGRADGRRGRDGINGETGRARSRLAAGRRLPPALSPCWRAGWVWGASRMGFRRRRRRRAVDRQSCGAAGAVDRAKSRRGQRPFRGDHSQAFANDSPRARQDDKTKRGGAAQNGTQSALTSLASLAARNAQGYLALPSRCGRSHRHVPIRQKSAGGGATKMQHTAKLQLRCAINAALWLRRAC